MVSATSIFNFRPRSTRVSLWLYGRSYQVNTGVYDRSYQVNTGVYDRSLEFCVKMSRNVIERDMTGCQLLLT